MSKQSIILIAVLIVALAGVGAAHKFYVQPLIEEYAKDERFYEQLEQKLVYFEETFSKTRPDEIVKAWSGAVQPWSDATGQRERFFHFENKTEFTPVPEGAIAKFHYEAEYQRLMQGLAQEAYIRGRIQVPFNFAVPTPDTLRNEVITKKQVEDWLSQVAFGIDTVLMLLDAGAVRVDAVDIWPPIKEQGVLETRTVGLSFVMRLEDIAELTNGLLSDSRQFYRIDGFRIVNTDLVSYTQPFLLVEMRLTQARFLEGEKPRAAGGGGGRGNVQFQGLGSRQKQGSSTGSTFYDKEDEEDELRHKKKQTWYSGILRFFGFSLLAYLG